MSFSVKFNVMLGVHVASKIDVALERPGARAAGERLESGVLSTVRDEVRRLAERLGTHATHVRLLTCNGRGDVRQTRKTYG